MINALSDFNVNNNFDFAAAETYLQDSLMTSGIFSNAADAEAFFNENLAGK